MITDSIVVLSAFSGFPLQKLFLHSNQLSPLSIVPLTRVNEQVFSKQIKKIQKRGELPVILSSVNDAFSIQDQYPTLSFFFVFATPSSVEEYYWDVQKNYKDENDIIWNMEQAVQECDILWKYDLIIPLNRLYALSLEPNENAESENSDHFEILQFKERLSDLLQELKASKPTDCAY